MVGYFAVTLPTTVFCFISTYAIHPQQETFPYPPRKLTGHHLVLSEDNINPHCKVTGDQGPIRAAISKVLLDLESGPKKNFDRLLNLGIIPGSHETPTHEWKPLTFVRELLSAVVLPDSLQIVAKDVAARARSLLADLAGQSIASYTDPRGIPEIRHHVEEYLWKRDHVAANASQIFLSNGPIDTIRDISRLILTNINGKRRGILFPSATIQFDREAVVCEEICTTVYNLDPEDNWRITERSLQDAFTEQSAYCMPTAINIYDKQLATGEYLSRDDLETVVDFAWRHRLIIISYELNAGIALEGDAKMISVRRVAHEMKRKVEIITIISGVYPPVFEPGIRSGACEFLNFDYEVVDSWVEVCRYLRKTPNAIGQLLIEALVNPPKPGDDSFDVWKKETTAILRRLSKNGEIANKKIEGIPGISSEVNQTSLVMLVKLDLPDDYISKAESLGRSPDVQYVIDFISEYGVVVMPGSWANQLGGGTYVMIHNLNEAIETIIAFERWEEFQNSILSPKPY